MLRNAFCYSHEGHKITIQLRQEAQMLYISIIDQGESIPRYVQAKLFDVYQKSQVSQGDTVTSFGLSICKELMLGQNGDIMLINNPEREGNHFLLSIPIADSILNS